MRPKTRTANFAISTAFVLAGCKAGCGATDAPGRGSETAPHVLASLPASAAVTWREPIDVVTGEGLRGPWRMNESRFYYVDDPSVGILPDGSTAIVWVDNEKKDVFFQTLNEQGRPKEPFPPVDVSRSPDVFSWLPRLVLDSEGKVYVLWQEIVFSGGSHGGEIFFARSNDGGRSFEAPVNLSNTPAGDGKGRLTQDRWHNGSLDLAKGAGGAVFAAWTEYEGNLWFARSQDRGRSFESPRRIAGTTARPARGPSLAISESGVVYLAWTVGEDPEADIFATTSRDGGQSFATPRVVFDSDGHSDAPSLAVDRQGVVHVTYCESPSGPFGRYHVVYARLSGELAVLTAPRRISGQERGALGAAFPSLAIDDDDRLYVVWDHYPDFRKPPHGLGFAFASAPGKRFSAPSTIPGTVRPGLERNGNLQGQLSDKLDVGGDGTVVVVNSRFDPGQSSRVRLIRGRAQ